MEKSCMVIALPYYLMVLMVTEKIIGSLHTLKLITIDH